LSGLCALIEPDLIQWGEEANMRDRSTGPDGWPAETTLAKFAREGFHGAGQGGGGGAPMSDRSLAVDVTVAGLRPRPKKAVKLFYKEHRRNGKMAAYAFGRGNRWFGMCLKEGREKIAWALLPNSAL